MPIITKEQFIEGVVGFLDTYKRLPILNGDYIELIEIENGEEKEKRYAAGKYIKEFYKTNSSFLDCMFNEGVLSTKKLSNITGFTETVIRNFLSKEVKSPDQRLRRLIHVITGKDYYEEEFGSFNLSHCNICKKQKQCGQDYWVEVISCGKHEKKKNKK